MKKNKGIKIAIIVLLVILILGGILLAYIYMGTNILKTDKQAFFNYISEEKQIGNILKEDSLEKYLEKIENTPHTTEGSLTVDTNVSEYENLANNANITFSGNKDIANKYADEEIALNYQNEEILKVNYINSNDYYGMKIQDIIKKYLVIENNNLKQFAENMGITDTSGIPDKIETKTIQDSKSTFTDEEIAQIKEKYITNIIMQNLTDDCFSKDDTSGEYVVYKLTIKESKIKEIEKQILTTLKDDDMIMNKLKQSYIETSNCTEEEATKYIEEFKEKIEEYIQEESSNNETSTTDVDTVENELIVTLYISDNKISKAEIEYDTDKIVIELQENKVIASIQEASTSNGEENSVKEFKEEGKITFEKIKNEDNLEYKISMVPADNTDVSVVATLDISGISSLEKVTEKLTIDMTEDEENASIVYENKRDFNSSIEKQELNEDNMEILNDYSAEEMKKLYENLVNAIVTSKGEKIESLIGNTENNQSTGDINSTDLTDTEKEAFNAKFESFYGENVSAAEVKSLINTININNDGGTHIIEEVIYNGKSIKTSEEVFEEEIDTSKEYIVAFQKNEDGYIYRVAIKEK